LAQSWRTEFGESDQAIVRRMLEYYRSLIFIYTLSPPILGEDSLDEFLFDTKRGFCEHFAAGFVFMMRAAGIPARVVTGYQGGAINPVDGTLIVRQSDAHAWAEIWLKGRGWVRVDPTAAIAPSRIENNLAVALPAGDARPLLARPEFVWLLHARYRWDALANIWNQWVLGYNPQRQRDLLTSWGMRSPDWQQMTVVLTVLCGTLLLAYSLWAIHQRQRIDPALRAWNRLSKILARQGLARTPWEGPQAYASRIAKTLPPADASYAAEVAAIADIYAQIRYAQYSPPQAMLRELKTRITKLAQFK
jgi:transglutaminase-like putative cysteine protease